MDPHASEFKRISRTLNKHKVDYMLIGGYAVIFHGFTRTTADIDFWFKPTIDNYTKLLNAIEEFGVDTSQLNEVVFNPGNTYLRFQSRGIKIEFLSSIPGKFNYKEASMSSVTAEISGVKVKVINLGHLIENKSVLNRPIDRLDVEELKKRRKTK